MTEKTKEKRGISHMFDELFEPLTKEELIIYLDDLKESYREILYGDRDVLFKLVDVWHYVGRHFPGQEKNVKKLLKK